MNETKNMAVLFDLDGVILDTESQYTLFWDQVGKEYLDIDHFGERIKGQTLTYIYNTFFSHRIEDQPIITAALNRFEQEMSYDYIPGAKAFIEDLRCHNVNMAIVTSSNDAKMQAVGRARPELFILFRYVLTAEMFVRSKPAPDCFMMGMELFGATPQHTYVFEDSFNGLKAGMDSGATVIGVATTNPRHTIEDKAHHIINDFEGMTYDKLIKSYTFAAKF